MVYLLFIELQGMTVSRQCIGRSIIISCISRCIQKETIHFMYVDQIDTYVVLNTIGFLQIALFSQRTIIAIFLECLADFHGESVTFNNYHILECLRCASWYVSSFHLSTSMISLIS